MSKPSFFQDLKPVEANFLEDTLCGLSADPKWLHSKYLYDARGAKLFEDICETEEYYITRTERALLDEIGGEIKDLAGAGARLVEFGMGDGEKARLVLSIFDQPQGFIGIDISREQLRDQIHNIAEDFPEIEVGGICADFFDLDGLPADDHHRDIGFLPGSTIGNFSPSDQKRLMAAMLRALGREGSLLIGVDLKKDADLMNAAYDDRAGVTAAFSLNLLARINRELGGDIEIKNFKHEAIYNESTSCIEICLRSLCDQVITIGDRRFALHAGEPIHTEKAYKFAPEEFQQLARETGWNPGAYWMDADHLFSIHWLDAA